jgi:hypothetical protein
MTGSNDVQADPTREESGGSRGSSECRYVPVPLLLALRPPREAAPGVTPSTTPPGPHPVCSDSRRGAVGESGNESVTPARA